MEWRQIERAARGAGFKVSGRTRHGFFIEAPNGDRYLLHRQPSPMQVKRAISWMRKHGFVWPPKG